MRPNFALLGAGFVALAGALAGATASACAAVTVPTASALNAEIDAKGPKEVVARLSAGHPGPDEQNDWSRVTNQMALGRAAYIKLAPKLAPGTDAGTAEELEISLASALLKAPMTVLGVIDLKDEPLLGVSRVCGAPFIEGTITDLPGYRRRAKAAVSKVRAPELRVAKNACLTALGK